MRRDGWGVALEVFAGAVGASIALAPWWAVLRELDAVAGWWAP